MAHPSNGIAICLRWSSRGAVHRKYGLHRAKRLTRMVRYKVLSARPGLPCARGLPPTLARIAPPHGKACFVPHLSLATVAPVLTPDGRIGKGELVPIIRTRNARIRRIRIQINTELSVVAICQKFSIQ